MASRSLHLGAVLVVVRSAGVVLGAGFVMVTSTGVGGTGLRSLHLFDVFLKARNTVNGLGYDFWARYGLSIDSPIATTITFTISLLITVTSWIVNVTKTYSTTSYHTASVVAASSSNYCWCNFLSPLSDGHGSDISSVNSIEHTDSGARMSFLVEVSDGFLEALDKFIIFKLWHGHGSSGGGFGNASHDEFLDVHLIVHQEVSVYFLVVHEGHQDGNHGGSHHSHINLTGSMRCLTCNSDDIFNLLDSRGGHARDGSEHFEVVDGSFSGVNGPSTGMASSGGFVELFDADLDSGNSSSHIKVTTVFLEVLGSHSVDLLDELGIVVLVLAFGESHKSVTSLLELLSINYHVVVMVNVVEDSPGLHGRGDSQARDGGVSGSNGVNH
jgi:hypothetical protein